MSKRPSSLFPSANAVNGASTDGHRVGRTADTSDTSRERRESCEADPEIIDADHTLTRQGTDNLDWLTNKSFRSDDAIVIANQHHGKEEKGGFIEIASSSYHGTPGDSTSSIKGSTGNDNVESSLRSNTLQAGREGSLSKAPHRHHDKKHKHKRDYETRSDDDKHRRKRHYDRHHRHKTKKHSKAKRGRNEYDSSGDSSQESDNCKDLRVSAEKTHASGSFRIDVKSDKNNLCFDSLHFTDTVAYHRLGHSCLGLDRHRQLVSWKDVKPKKKHKAESNGMRYFTSGFVEPDDDRITHIDFRPVETDHLRVYLVQDPVSYIPINHPSSQPKPDFDPLGIYDPSTQAYLGSKPPPNLSETGESQTDYQSKSTISSCSAATKTTAFYNRHLHENPDDVQKWLEFVRFQDSVEYDRLGSTGSGQSQQDIDASTNQSSMKRTAKMIMEKKLAILEKALLRNPNSIPLQLEQLEIGKAFWDVSDLSRQWEKLLKSNPGDVALWREYLLFKQGCFSTFSTSKVAGLYGKCFRTLVSKWEDLDGCKAAELENQLLDLFVALCHYWRQAGHTEKAAAAFQAMVELNCFCPPPFQQDTHLQGQIAFLETFWDSSEPRFGEKEAKGWANWMLRKERGGWEQVKIPEVGETSDEPSSPTTNSPNQPLWQAWVQEEVFREQNHFAPWRPDHAKGETEEDCEDPERMVLFDDINHILFRLSSSQKKFQLVLLFLDFLGVSIPRCFVQSPGEVTDTTRLYVEQPSQIFSPSRSTISSVCSQSFAFSGVYSNCRSLEQITNNSGCIKETSTYNPALGEFVEEVFNQITPVFPEPARTQLMLMRLDFQMQRAMIAAVNKQQKKKNLREAKRFAKKLLSLEENRNNLDLWSALARWERFLGNTEEAKRVLQTALVVIGQPQAETDKQAATRLAQTCVDLFVHFDFKSLSHFGDEDSSNMEVLHTLTTVAEGTVFSHLKDVPGQCVSSTRILKARRNYQELTTQVLASYRIERNESQDVDMVETAEWCQPSGSYVVHLTKCFAIFQYLTVGMQAASVVFESSLSAIKRRTTTLADSSYHRQLKLDQELLTVAHVSLLSTHVYNNPSPLGALRNLIKTSLVDFPSNSTLLEAFIHSETKSHIAGRVRRYFDRVINHTGCATQWLYAVRAELLRREALVLAATAGGDEGLPEQQNKVSETGISHRIRALFDRASESQNSRHCVLLWRMYMQFEVHQGNMKRAESIFYSALQHCPWAKVLYVDAVRYFPSKLQDIQDLLIEKELRIRAPLEEVELLIKS